MSLPPPEPEVSSDSDCPICCKPIVTPSSYTSLEPSDIDTDDVKLGCNHHYHMGCLVDTIVSSPSSQHRCAICRTNFGDVSGGFMVTGRLDTGGIGEIDLGPMIDEVEREAYYRAHPGARRADMFQQ